MREKAKAYANRPAYASVAASLIQGAEAMEAQAAIQDDLAEILGAERARLTSSHGHSTILPPVTATASSADLIRGIARSKSKRHPFVRALYEHPDPAKRMTVQQWAERHGYKAGTVASWYAKPTAKGNGGRRIPIKAALAIESEYGVPATVAVWRNGITTD